MNYDQNADVHEDNPALEEGICFLIPNEQLADKQLLNVLVQDLCPYYEVKLHQTPKALKFKCLNAIERDPLTDFDSLLKYMSRREDDIQKLLEKYGLTSSGVSLFFSHNCYGDFHLSLLALNLLIAENLVVSSESSDNRVFCFRQKISPAKQAGLKSLHEI